MASASRGIRLARLLAVIIALLTSFAFFSSGAAQGKTLHWERYDVTIDIHQDGTFTVTEDQIIAFTSGTFREGYAVMPLSKVESIDNVQVFEDGEPYTSSSSQGMPGTYSVSTYGGELEILWWFDPASNESRNFTIQYDVSGGLRVYEDVGRDQLWWRAIDEDFAADIREASVTVNLPESVPQEQLNVAHYERGIDGVQTEMLSGDQIRYTASNIDQGDALEVRLEFPKITAAVEPDWQEAAEKQEEREERLEPLKALANLLFLGGGLLLIVGAPVGTYLLWHTRGRDVPVETPIDLLREPPDDLAPGAVGTLIDETADIHDMIATLVDLAERGVITIEETKSEFLGLTFNRDWKIRLVDRGRQLREPERLLIDGLFKSGETEVEMGDVRKRFTSKQKDIKKAMYEEIVRHGYFPTNPESVRNRWRVAGFVIVAATVIVGFNAWGAVNDWAPMVIVPFIGGGLLGVSLLVGSSAMPRKTKEGAEAAARWLAFKRYLEEIGRHQDLSQAREIFSMYLPYAIAFGIEREWVRKFERVGAPAPHWYWPYGHYGHGHTSGGGTFGSGSGGGFDGVDVPSVQDVSEGFSGSLQSMSDGLFGMFDEAATAFKPYSSSGSGSSGGFSGGGGSFGGGGGGGGRGFS